MKVLPYDVAEDDAGTGAGAGGRGAPGQAGGAVSLQMGGRRPRRRQHLR